MKIRFLFYIEMQKRTFYQFLLTVLLQPYTWEKSIEHQSAWMASQRTNHSTKASPKSSVPTVYEMLYE